MSVISSHQGLKILGAGILSFIILFHVSCSPQQESKPSKFKIQPEDNIISVQQFDLSNVRLLDSPFKAAMKRDGEYLLSLEPARLLAPYLEEAGLNPKAEHYGGWESTGLDGHSLGHYITACSMMFAAGGGDQFQQRVDTIVSELERAQNAIGTGYIGGVPNGQKVFNEISNGNIDSHPFELNGEWVPWYNLHKLFAGLRDAYLYTNNETALQVLTKLSDWAVETLEPLSEEQFDEMIIAEFGGMNEVLADVYAITGGQKYLELAKRFNDERIFDPLKKREDKLAGLHANTQIPKVIGAAREYELTGSDSLKQVATFFWNTVINNRTYVNGGNSLDEHFGELGELHERLGKTTSESCNTYNMLKLTEHLMKWDPTNLAYADYYERALYNHILASQDPKTGRVCYFMPLSSGHFKTFSSPENSFWCCVGSGMENHTKYGKNIYLHNASDLIVNLFIPSEVQWESKGITLRQVTEFPENESTTLTVQADNPTQFNMKIRKPSWTTDEFAVSVNGEPIDVSDPQNYVELNREWQDGDQVEVVLPMDLHLESFPDSNQQKAIMYGPVLLAGKLGSEGMDGQIPYAGFEGFDGRWDHRRYLDLPVVDVPTLNPSREEPISNWVVPVEDSSLLFKTKGVGQPQDVELAPYYQINHQRYAIYWNIGNKDN